jgi:hypothetical protein
MQFPNLKKKGRFTVATVNLEAYSPLLLLSHMSVSKESN